MGQLSTNHMLTAFFALVPKGYPPPTTDCGCSSMWGSSSAKQLFYSISHLNLNFIIFDHGMLQKLQPKKQVQCVLQKGYVLSAEFLNIHIYSILEVGLSAS